MSWSNSSRGGAGAGAGHAGIIPRRVRVVNTDFISSSYKNKSIAETSCGRRCRNVVFCGGLDMLPRSITGSCTNARATGGGGGGGRRGGAQLGGGVSGRLSMIATGGKRASCRSPARARCMRRIADMKLGERATPCSGSVSVRLSGGSTARTPAKRTVAELTACTRPAASSAHSTTHAASAHTGRLQKIISDAFVCLNSGCKLLRGSWQRGRLGS